MVNDEVFLLTSTCVPESNNNVQLMLLLFSNDVGEKGDQSMSCIFLIFFSLSLSLFLSLASTFSSCAGGGLSALLPFTKHTSMGLMVVNISVACSFITHTHASTNTGHTMKLPPEVTWMKLAFFRLTFFLFLWMVKEMRGERKSKWVKVISSLCMLALVSLELPPLGNWSTEK